MEKSLFVNNSNLLTSVLTIRFDFFNDIAVVIVVVVVVVVSFCYFIR